MLNYLDGYPVELPCRYANKVACYTKVYLVSNIPLDEQYPNVQQNEPESWKAFNRRIHEVRSMTRQFEELPQDDDLDWDTIFGESGG